MLAATYAMNPISDVSWAYAMLLTTPLLVTVGLGLTIPIALLVQMVLLWKIPGILYWIGATLVFSTFFSSTSNVGRKPAKMADAPVPTGGGLRLLILQIFGL